ncbi:MAG: Undecaprenyl-phosphate mannosyltransferase [Ilumatobacteraceae bacterium]|nr:Undecaprenyl-phosphate mannosyltransferase [Ilumatobacteraceae bacterium]
MLVHMSAAIVDLTSPSTTPAPTNPPPADPPTPMNRFAATFAHPESQTLVFDPEAADVPVTVDVVIPVFNEQEVLPDSIARLHAYLGGRMPFTWRITIADNASTDATWAVSCQLAQTFPGVRAMHLDAKGRGRALRTAWSASDATVVAYMDVDLSTDLDALLPLVAPLVSGHSDIAIGTRLASTARVSRGPRREAVSRTYNLILRAALHAGFSDAQCGFKAVRGEVAKALLPLVIDQGWFFDTELLVLAEHNGLRIHEVPVDWVDDPDSRVHIASTARDDLRGVWRLVRSFARGQGVLPAPLHDAPPARRRPTLEQLVRFVSIGAVSTVMFATLFLLLHLSVGAVAADVIALAACTVVNTAANRRLTFDLHGRTRRVSHQLRGLAAATVPLALNLAALGIAHLAGVHGAWPLVFVLTVANVVASLVKFVLLQHWVFSARGGATSSS